MKFIVGVIRGRSLEELTHALGRAGVYRLTVSEVDEVEIPLCSPLGEEERSLRIEVAVNDPFAPAVLDAFARVRGDEDPAWVGVFPLEDVVRIRTSESGPEAI